MSETECGVLSNAFDSLPTMIYIYMGCTLTFVCLYIVSSILHAQRPPALKKLEQEREPELLLNAKRPLLSTSTTTSTALHYPLPEAIPSLCLYGALCVSPWIGAYYYFYQPDLLEQFEGEMPCFVAEVDVLRLLLTSIFMVSVVLTLFVLPCVRTSQLIKLRDLVALHKDREQRVLTLSVAQGKFVLPLMDDHKNLDRQWFVLHDEKEDEDDEEHDDNEWFDENLRRLAANNKKECNVQQLRVALRKGELEHKELPPESMDVIYLPVFTTIKSLIFAGSKEPDALANLVRIRVLDQCFRLLKPGGRLVILNAILDDALLRKLLTYSSFQNMRVTKNPSCVYLSVLRPHVYTVVKTVGSKPKDRVEGHTGEGAVLLADMVHQREALYVERKSASRTLKRRIILVAIVAVMAATAALHFWLTPILWPLLQYPKEFSHNSRFCTWIVENIVTMPIAGYFLVRRWTNQELTWLSVAWFFIHFLELLTLAHILELPYMLVTYACIKILGDAGVSSTAGIVISAFVFRFLYALFKKRKEKKMNKSFEKLRASRSSSKR